MEAGNNGAGAAHAAEVEYWIGTLRSSIRNHFAADCGFDRDKIRAALSKAIERCASPLYVEYRPPRGLTEADIAAGVERAIAEELAPLVGVTASEVVVKPIFWFWPGRIARRTLTVLDGDPGDGKSVLSVDLAAHATNGRPFLDGTPCPRGRAVLFTAEDAADTIIVPRLRAAEADLTRCLIVEIGVKGKDGEPRLLTMPQDLTLIEDTILRFGALFVVIDPLTSFLSGEVNSHKDQDIRRVLAALAGIAYRTGAAIVVIRHLNKSAGTNALYRGGGSIGIIAAARAGYLLARDPNDRSRRIFAHTKFNLGPEPEAALAFRLVPHLVDHLDDGQRIEAPRVEWILGEEITLTSRQLLREPKDDDDEHGRDHKFVSAIGLLTEMLANGPRLVKEIDAAAAAAGISEKTLRRARAAVGVEPAKRDFKGGWMLKLAGQIVADEGGQEPEGGHEGGQPKTSWPPSADPLGEKDLAEGGQLDSDYAPSDDGEPDEGETI